MPTISEFFGIVIRLYFNDHAPPHFHAIYNEHEAVIDITGPEVLEGFLPRRALYLTGLSCIGQSYLQTGSFAVSTSSRTRSIPWSNDVHWTVVSVEPILPGTLTVRFADGTEGRVRLEATHLYGVFEPLKDPEVFLQARVECGAVSWPGEIDLAPDAMYSEIKRSGEWVLR